MNGIRSRRRKLAEGMERSLSDLLHERMAQAFRVASGNQKPPENTSAIYAWAVQDASGMLEQLFQVHVEAAKERGEIPARAQTIPSSDADRKRMLSAIRASVNRTRPKFHG